jgi:transposase
LSGKRAFGLREFYLRKKITVIGVIKQEGVLATEMIEGSMKGKDFNRFIKESLVPKLRVGDVVILDNLNSHHHKDVREGIEAAGARVEYLPVYSPEFNPIKMMWSELKSMVQKFRTRTIESLEKLIEMAIRLVCKSHLEHWFTKCYYCTK